MDFSLLERAKAFLRAQRKKNIWYRTMCGLAAVVVFVTTYMLILPAITLEKDTICGKEAHTHTEKCYEEVTIAPQKVLNCTKEALGIHEHEDECYDSDQNLICGYADFVVHTHDENCYDEDGKLVCDLPEIKEHEHTASCYTEEQGDLTCGQEESEGHQHSDDCYTEEKGELTCGTEEHTHIDSCKDADGNYICEKEEHTHDDKCYEWDQKLVCTQAESTGHTHTDACYETVKTLTCDEQEAILHTHMDACYENGTLACGKLEVKNHQHADECFEAKGGETTEKKLICEKEDHEHDDTCYKEEDDANVPMPLGGNGEDTVVNEQSLNVTATSGTATYNKEKDTFSVEMTIDFTIDNSDPASVVKNTYVYTYPQGYPVPAALTEGSHTLHDKSGNNAGTYTFRENDDGTYSVLVQISEEYAKAQKTGQTITGYISYKGTMDGIAENEDGNLVIGSDTEEIIIVPSENITYPDGETHNYNVQTEKNGEYKIENNQLIYMVKVYSTKGTPGVINFKDTITVDGLTLGVPSVTVQEMNRTNYGGWQTEWTVNENSSVNVEPGFSNDNKTIVMVLPQLEKPTSTSDNGNFEKGYLVTYIYDLTDAGEVSVTANNKVQVSSNDGNNGPTVTDDASKDVGIDRTFTFEKSGSYDRTTGTIKWTIKVNNNKTDIAGASITDEMFSQAIDGTFTVEPNSGYTYDKSNNTVTFNPLNDSGSNNQTYTIAYSTVVDSIWDEQSIQNKAVFDPTPNNPDSGDEIERDSTVTVGGGGVEKLKLSESIADDKQSAEVEWKVTIHVPDSGLPAETEITDTASEGIWMTKGQITDWNCVLYWQDANDNTVSSTNTYHVPGANVTFKGSDGNTYSFNQISQNEGGLDNLTFQLIKIKLAEALTRPESATKLVFTYKTTVDLSNANDGWNKYTNTVKVNDKEASAEFNYEVKTPHLSKTHGNVTYTEDDQNKYINIPWTVTIEVPDIGWLIGKTLIDDLTRTEWNEGNVHFITYQEALNMVTGAKWENGTAINLADADSFEVNFVTKENVEYTYQQLCAITDESQKNSLEFTSFTITPRKIVNRPENETKIVLNVSSRADVITVETGGERYYRNWAHIGNQNASDQYQYINRQNSVVKYDGNWHTGNTTVTSSDGKVYWIVEVQLDNQVHNRVSVTDTLPEGVTLESLKITIDSKGECYPTILENGTITGEINGYTVSGTYTQSTRAIELTVCKSDSSALDTNKIQFYINCLANENLKDKSAHTLENRVVAKIDDVEIGSSTQTQDWTYQEQAVSHDKVTKNGKWDNNARLLEYQVAINPDGLDLVEGSDTLLTLVDELTYNHRNSGYQVENNTGGTDWVDSEYHFQINLLQNRVKLYFAKVDSNGNLLKDDTGAYLKDGEVTGWSWTFSNSQIDDWRTMNTLTITGIPDGTPLIMEYAYKVSSDLPEKAYIQNLPISNTAKLKGNNEIGSGSHSGGEWKEQTTTGEVDSDKKVLKLVKVEKEHFENVLSGAEFTVYKSTGTSDAGELIWSAEAIRTYTTDDTGSFSIQREEKGADGQTVEFTYAYNTLYKVVETKAPDGYLISDTAKEYYFYFSSSENNDNTLPGSLPAGSMDLSVSAFTVYAENVKQSTDVDTTEITVQKKWQDSNGADIDHNNGSVTINLYQKNSQGSSSGGGTGESGNLFDVKVGIKDENNSYVYAQDIQGTLGSSETSISVPLGTVVTIELYCQYATESWASKWKDSSATANGVGLTRIEQNEGKTYIFQCTINENTIIDVWKNWGDGATATVTITIPTDTNVTDSSESDNTDENSSVVSEGTPIKTVSLSKDNGWHHTFTDLPLTGTDVDGNTVNYYYYVQEVSVPNYSTSYTNNGGIQSGTITVTNKATDNPTYELPETGGPGTRIAYTLGSILILLASAAFLYIKKRNDGKKGGLA